MSLAEHDRLTELLAADKNLDILTDISSKSKVYLIFRRNLPIYFRSFSHSVSFTQELDTLLDNFYFDIANTYSFKQFHYSVTG